MRFFPPDGISKEMFEGKDYCHFDIGRAEAESQDFQRIDGFFDSIKSYGTSARQKVYFSFAGYNDDKRELIYIPEPVEYVRTLISRHPYFWYYAIPHNSEFFYLALFINKNDMTVADVPSAKKFYLKQDKEGIHRLVTTMAMNLNIFGEEIGDIDEATKCLKLWAEKIIGEKL